MALGNWDYISWNNQGKDGNDYYRSKGISIELYKNWAYVYSREIWKILKLNSFAFPTICAIDRGELDLFHLKIYAERFPKFQEAFFIIVVDKGKIWGGIGVYGYKLMKDPSKCGDIWLGVENRTKERFFEWANSLDETIIDKWIKKINGVSK